MDLKNKVAIVTGASQGIGKAVALVLAKYGANIVAADIKTDGITQVVEKTKLLGRRGLAVTMDVSNKEQVNTAVRKATEEFGEIDILVNCAGIIASSLVVDLKEDIWDKIMDVNAKGVFLVSQAVAKEMIKNSIKGKIVNISSIAAKVGEAGNGPYCASKAAVSMLTQVLALELAPYGINVNAICPGHTDTEMMQQVFQKRGPIEGFTPEQYKGKLILDIPLKRMAKPEEIGELVAFLVSDKSEYVTGVAITIAGGKLLF